MRSAGTESVTARPGLQGRVETTESGETLTSDCPVPGTKLGVDRRWLAREEGPGGCRGGEEQGQGRQVTAPNQSPGTQRPSRQPPRACRWAELSGSQGPSRAAGGPWGGHELGEEFPVAARASPTGLDAA